MLPQSFHRILHQQHRELHALISAGDGNASADAMRAHLDFLRPLYEKAWAENANLRWRTTEAEVSEVPDSVWSSRRGRPTS